MQPMLPSEAAALPVPAGAPVHYSGSPLQLDFGETAETKSVTIIEATPGKPAEVDTKKISRMR